MAVCFGVHPDGNCLGPQPDRDDDTVVGPLCGVCEQLRYILAQRDKHEPELAALVRKQMVANEKRLGAVKTFHTTPGTTGALLQRQVSERAEKEIRGLIKRTLAVMGAAPCKWAFMVCGSIARREAVAFSDIDALFVTESDDPEKIKWFKDAAVKMQQVLWESGGDTSQFKFCPGGLSPAMVVGTPEWLVAHIDKKAKAGDHHMLAALQSSYVAGDHALAVEYEDCCHGYMRQGRKASREAALQELQRHMQKRNTHFLREGWRLPEDDDALVNVKSQLYRPVHMIVGSLAQYYQVEGLSTRAQVLGLVESDHMSVRVAYSILNTLDDIAYLRMERQLQANTEYELVKRRNLKKKEKFGFEPEDTDLARDERLGSARQVATIDACVKRVKMFWDIADLFVKQKTGAKQGSRDNPFNAAIMSAEKFNEATKATKARVGWALGHPGKKHPLVQMHTLLGDYHKMEKQFVVKRHALLKQLIDIGSAYLGKKNEKLAKKAIKKSKSDPDAAVLIQSPKAQAVLDVVESAKERLAREVASAKALAKKVTTKSDPKLAQIHRGLRFERVATGGGVAITGAELLQKAREGWFGELELSPNESDDENDLYILKKVVNSLTDEKVDEINRQIDEENKARRAARKAPIEPIKKLEYADDAQRRQYAVEITEKALNWKSTKAPVDTLATVHGDPPRTALYAMSADGRIFARNFDSQLQRGVFQHSSFMAGEDVICAGTLKVATGRLIEISNLSGHYQPTVENLIEACWNLADAGYDCEGAYALAYLVNDAVMQNPRATGHFRFPVMALLLANGLPENIFDYEVCAARDAVDGKFVYTDPVRAKLRGCMPEGDTPPKAPQGNLKIRVLKFNK
jgi:hypothetical protein